ncbi:MAG: hypothetical protein WA624_16020, partial [Methylocella sp.]
GRRRPTRILTCKRANRWFRQHRERRRPSHPVYRGADRFAGQPIAMMARRRRRFSLRRQESSPKARDGFSKGAKQGRRGFAPRGKTSQPRQARDIALALDRGRAAARRRELQRKDATAVSGIGVAILATTGRGK